jgi:integrase
VPSDPPVDPRARGDETGFLEPLDRFLLDKGTGRDRSSGAYRADAEREIREFADWYRASEGVPPTFARLSDRDFRRYARALVGPPVGDGHADAGGADEAAATDPIAPKDLSDGSARTYYARVSAYVGWCVDEGYLDAHLAQTDRATGPLPADDGRRSGDQQAWTPADRARLLRHLRDRRADVFDAGDDPDIGVGDDPDIGPGTPGLDAADPDLDDAGTRNLDGDHDPGLDEWAAVRSCRDYALVATLCYSGIRGGELLSHPQDDRRTGVTWADLDLADKTLTVLAKRQTTTYDDRSLPDPARDALGLLRSVLAPSNDDWPLFPTLDRASLYDPLRDAMADAGVPAADVEQRLRAEPTWTLCRRHGVTPPALTTTGARGLLERRCAAAGIELDPDARGHAYLTPHGARRGVGEVLVREKGFAAAARLLDDSERMVRERYSHIEAGELADEATDAFESHDG